MQSIKTLLSNLPFSARTLWLGFFGILVFSPFAMLFWNIYQNGRTMRLQEEILEGILQQMSLEEKVGQLLHIGLPKDRLGPKEARLLSEIRPGGIILFKRNFSRNDTKAGKLKKLIQDAQVAVAQEAGIPLLVSIDQEGGRILRLHPPVATAFPSALSIGQTENPYFARLSALLIGSEMRRLGIQLVLAPVVDVNNNPDNPVIGTRSFGSDPKKVAKMAVAYTKGALLARSGPVLKHFPGHGNTDTDSHKALPVIPGSQAELWKTELRPFKKAIDKGAPIVMVAHILVPALDKKYPATLSRKITTGLLRRQLGFEGLAMTDALEMKAVADRYRQLEVARLAIQAGADILLFADPPPGLLRRIRSHLIDLYKKGELPLEALDQSVKRQLRYKLRAAVFQDYYKTARYPRRLGKLKQKFINYHELTAFHAGALQKDALSHYGKTPAKIATDICKASIRSSASPHPVARPEESLLFYETPAFQKAAQKAGIPASRLRDGGLGAFLRLFSTQTQGQTQLGPVLIEKAYTKGSVDGGAARIAPIRQIFIELSSANLSAWNRLLKQKRILERLPKGLRLTGLYNGNPFHRIRLRPPQVEVLLSPSPPDVCATGFVERIFDQRHPKIPVSSLPVADGKK